MSSVRLHFESLGLTSQIADHLLEALWKLFGW